MPGPTTKITNREKAAVLLAAAGLVDDWTELYFIAEDKSRKDAESVQFVAASVSRWKNSEKIKKCLAEYTKLLADREADARTEGRDEERRRETERRRTEENERTERDAGKPFAATVDYYDPANQRTQINRIIQESGDDPRTQLDAIKTIQQTQRDDKQAAKDQQIQRFYTPVKCSSCPIRQEYEKRQARKATK